jgi:hypothetical protein
LARAKQRSAGGQLYPSRSGHLLASAEVIETTEHVVSTARAVLPKAREKAESCGDLMRGIRLRGQCDSIERYCALADRVIGQTRRRVLKDEQVPVAEKIFSIFEPHTDCIVRGKAQKPVEWVWTSCWTFSRMFTPLALADSGGGG